MCAGNNDNRFCYYLLLLLGKQASNGFTVFLSSDFLNDFFKPNKADMTRIKSFKKSRHGRRVKQLEKIEQKMKEERQKRIRDRQKDFFGFVDAHRLAYFLLTLTFISGI